MSLTVVIAAMIIGSEKLYTYYKKTRNRRILIIGGAEVGKTTFIYQLENKSPVAPELSKTEKISRLAKNIKVEYKDKSRVIRTKDVPGEGYMTGEWWKLLLELKPQGIIFIVDDRLINEDLGKDQRMAFKYFTEILTSNEYKKLVKPKNRPSVMMVVANKMDIWGSESMNISIDSLLASILPDLHRLQNEGIVWNWAAMSAKYYQHVDAVYNWVLKTIENKNDLI